MQPINRTQYFIACIFLFLFGVVASYSILYFLTDNYKIADYLVSKITIKIIVAVCFIYVSLRRLKSIMWPQWLALLFALSVIFDANLWMLLSGDAYIDKYDYIFDVSSLLSGLLFFVLLLKRPVTTKE
jgi:uncharacterized membrane protein YhaH (DUF805 family)